jgi:hypothetical protein
VPEQRQQPINSAAVGPLKTPRVHTQALKNAHAEWWETVLNDYDQSEWEDVDPWEVILSAARSLPRVMSKRRSMAARSVFLRQIMRRIKNGPWKPDRIAWIESQLSGRKWMEHVGERTSLDHILRGLLAGDGSLQCIWCWGASVRHPRSTVMRLLSPEGRAGLMVLLMEDATAGHHDVALLARMALGTLDDPD